MNNLQRKNVLVSKAIWILMITGVCGIFSCDESLPPRELRDFSSPIFRAIDPGDVFYDAEFYGSLTDTFMVGTGVSFAIGVKNNSIEVLQAKAKINGIIEITSPTNPAFRRVYEFTAPQVSDVTLLPSAEFTVNIPWDQRDDSCRFVFRGSFFEPITIGRTPWLRSVDLLTFRAKGRVQIWPNVETKELPEITFRRRYFINAEKFNLNFKNLVSCKPF